MRNCRSRCNCNRNRNYNYGNYMMDSYNTWSRTNSDCGCMNHDNDNYNDIYSNPFPSNYLYGHAYTPNQPLRDTFDPQTGLDNGSMFPELVSPYYPGQSMEFIEYLKTTGRNGGCGCE